jgi:hypothetical protein
MLDNVPVCNNSCRRRDVSLKNSPDELENGLPDPAYPCPYDQSRSRWAACPPRRYLESMLGPKIANASTCNPTLARKRDQLHLVMDTDFSILTLSLKSGLSTSSVAIFNTFGTSSCPTVGRLMNSLTIAVKSANCTSAGSSEKV